MALYSRLIYLDSNMCFTCVCTWIWFAGPAAPGADLWPACDPCGRCGVWHGLAGDSARGSSVWSERQLQDAAQTLLQHLQRERNTGKRRCCQGDARRHTWHSAACSINNWPLTSAEGHLRPDGAAAGRGGAGRGNRGDGEHTAGCDLAAAPVPVGSERSQLPDRHASDAHADHPAWPQRSAAHTLAADPGHGRRSVCRSTAAHGIDLCVCVCVELSLCM